MSAEVTVVVAGEALTLLPERAVLWPRTKTLFVADLHLGKTATFLASGIPVPEGVNEADLQRLTIALDRTQAEHLMVLGDLIHAHKSRSDYLLTRFGEWRRSHYSLDIVLVRGNHDQRAGDPPEEWRITCVDNLLIESPFVLRHAPEETDAGYVLAGHLHPGVQLVGRGEQRIKLPCFWFGKRIGVLPAFSRFTGVDVVKPVPGDKVFVVTEQAVISVV